MWRLAGAGTSAPGCFPPEVVEIGPRSFIVVDGGATACNYPSFLLFVRAVLERYRLGWETGAERLLLVSVATASGVDATADLQPTAMNLLTVPAPPDPLSCSRR